MRDINLLIGLKSRRKFDLKKSTRRAVILILAAAVLLGGTALAMRYLTGQYERQMAELSAEMAQYREVGQLKAAITDKTRLVESLTQLIETAERTSRVESGFFDTVGGAMNESVFLTSVALNEDGTVSLAGKGTSREQITYFIYNLKLTGAFEDVTFSVITLEKNEAAGTQLYGFAASATLVPEEVPAGE